jgi:hypothetical protein
MPCSSVDFLASGWENIFLLYSEQSVGSNCNYLHSHSKTIIYIHTSPTTNFLDYNRDFSEL